MAGTQPSLWLGVVLAAHGCLVTPLTVTANLFAGPNVVLFMAAIQVIGTALVTNLAPMLSKITTAFALRLRMDIAIVLLRVFLATA